MKGASWERLLPHVCVLILFLPFVPIWLSGEVLLSNDAANFEIPALTYWKTLLLSGDWDGWYPYSNLGMPVTGALLGRVFYVPQLWFLFFDPATGLLGYYLLHSVIAYAGAYRYLRSHEVDPLPARLGALVYAGSSARVHLSGNVVFYPMLTLAPALLWCLEQLIVRPGPARALALSLVVTLIGAGGGWQLTMIFGMNFALWGMMYWWRHRSLGSVLWLSVAGFLSLLASAPTVLPLAEQSHQGVVRSVAFRPDMLQSSTVVPDLQLSAFYSPFYGSQAERSAATGRNVHEFAAVPGIALSCLWLAGCLPLPRRRAWVAGWGALLLLDFWLALGVSGPGGLWLFQNVPGWANFRVAVRFLTPFPLLLMGLVAFGWERLGSRSLPMLGLPALLYYALFCIWGRSDWGPAHGLLLLSVVVNLALAASVRWRRPLVWLAMLLQLAAPVLFVRNSLFANPGPAFQEQQLLGELRQQLRPGETIYYSLNPERTVLAGVRNVAGFSPLALRRAADYLFWMLHGRDATSEEWQQLMFMNFHPSVLAENARPGWPLNPMSRMLGVRFLFTERGIERLPAPLPGYWFSRDWKVGQADYQRADFDPEAAVWLEQQPTERPAWQAGRPSWLDWGVSRMRLQTGGASGWLTVAVPAYPGWEVRMDGQPVPWYRSYGLFMSVAVPPGCREVDFSYRCSPLWRGMAFLALAVLGWLGLAWWARRPAGR